MKRQFLSILLLFSFHLLNASQSIDWMKMPDILTNEGTSIVRDSANNIYTTTSTTSIILEKRDRFGNFKWQSISSTTVPLNYEFPEQVFVDPQGNPVVVGYRHTTSSDGHNANMIIVLKYDPLGNLIYKIGIQGTFSFFNNSRYWTNVSSRIDAVGNLYIGTAGNVTGYPTSGFNIIKLDPAGNIVRVSTKNFPSATNFHYVNMLRLSGNKVGVTGVTSYSSANATSWVMDTSGVDLWNDISAGVQGKDLAFDKIGNTFMLTWVSVAQTGDVSLTKFDSTGIIIWNHTYDFGGSDLSSRMEMTPDSNLAIMAYGNSYPGNSLYTDWITFKTDLAGTKLWSDRYDEHSSNDEYPGMLAVDPDNNIYVTGIGGPFPGGSNLGKRQMITVKYSPAGNREWEDAIDTINEYMTGVGMVIGYDKSIFVLGDVKTFIVHYFDHTGNDTCVSPMNLTTISIGNDSVVVSWDSIPNAFLYHLQFKPANSNVWQMISTDTNLYILHSLFSGTLYDLRVEALCNSGPTGYSTPIQFTTTGSGYCTSMGLDATQEWIDLVYVNNLLNSTIETDSGYADYTYLSADLSIGITYDITLSAGMDIATHTEYWKVWIDFNRNGDFSDAGEEVVAYSSNQIGWETHSFQVPSTISPGPAIMRVSMKNGSPQTPCETFALGEVEDYTINVTTITAIQDSDKENSISINPNPAGNYITIDNKMNDALLKITDLSGRIVYSNTNNNSTIDIRELKNGFYVLQIENKDGSYYSKKFIKQD